MKEIRLRTDETSIGYSECTFTQYYKGQNVKIVFTTHNKYSRNGYTTVWATPEDANKFYKKRLGDGFKPF